MALFVPSCNISGGLAPRRRLAYLSRDKLPFASISLARVLRTRPWVGIDIIEDPVCRLQAEWIFNKQIILLLTVSVYSISLFPAHAFTASMVFSFILTIKKSKKGIFSIDKIPYMDIIIYFRITHSLNVSKKFC